MKTSAQEGVAQRLGFGQAVFWSYALTLGRAGSTLLLSLVLARILGPAAFGLIAMAGVYVLFVEMLVRQGLTAAVIQRPNLAPIHLDTAFWMTVVAVGILTPLSLALSGPWATLNRLPDLQPLIIALSPLIALRGLAVVQDAVLRRRMEFRVLALAGNASVFTGGAIGLVLAFAGAGVWALVAQQLTVALVELVILWVLGRWSPRLQFCREAARQLFGFSGRTALAGFGVFVNQRSDALLIGLLFGPVLVGLYRMAARLTEMVLEVAVGGLQSVSLPELSQHQGDGAMLNQRAAEIVRMSATVTMPMFAVLAVSSDALMAVVGEAWSSAADAVKILCVFAAAQLLALFTGPMLQAAGRPAFHAGLTWFSGAVSALSYLAAGLLLRGSATETQLLGLALVRVLAFFLVILVVLLPLMRWALGTSPWAMLDAAGRSAVGAAAGGGLAWGTLSYIESIRELGAMSQLGVHVLVAAVLSVAGVIVAEKYSRHLLMRIWRTYRRTTADEVRDPLVRVSK